MVPYVQKIFILVQTWDWVEPLDPRVAKVAALLLEAKRMHTMPSLQSLLSIAIDSEVSISRDEDGETRSWLRSSRDADRRLFVRLSAEDDPIKPRAAILSAVSSTRLVIPLRLLHRDCFRFSIGIRFWNAYPSCIPSRNQTCFFPIPEPLL